MKNNRMLRLVLPSLLLVWSGTQAAVTDIATKPLVTSSSTSVLPNVLFVLDDSGSMASDFMPDIVNDSHCKSNTSTYNQACTFGSALFNAGDFNGVTYNPTITYTPPKNADGSSFPAQNSANTSGWTVVKNDAFGKLSTGTTNLITSYVDQWSCTDSTKTDCLRNDNYIVPGVVNGKSYTNVFTTNASGTGNFVTGTPTAPVIVSRPVGPYYYSILPGEFCDSENLRNCSSTKTGAFTFPAPIRWCDSDANAKTSTDLANPSPSANRCQSVNTTTYNFARFPSKFFSGGATAAGVPASTTFTVGLTGCTGSRNAGIQTLTINGVNVLSSATTNTNSSSTLASRIQTRIGGGFTATRSGSSVTISAALSAGNVTSSVAITRTADSTCTPTISPVTPTFSGFVAPTAVFNGSFTRVDIVPSNNSYALPGTSAKAPTRTDCAGTTCTYAEEMTNFANWWTYYHTRIQMAKSSSSLSFSVLDGNFRVGYSSINNNTSTDFLNLAPFDLPHKTNWYAKLFNAKTGGTTPLRRALTESGRLYAGKLNASTFHGTTVTDPMQYSCQQNFTILTTDGYWNEADPGGFQLDGTTAIGDQDKALARPQLDGVSSGNTLADVAAFYYNTDLRTTSCSGGPVAPNNATFDVCENNVPKSGLDAAAHQHMTTFTVGLGAPGLMQFTPSYASAGNLSGDFFNIKNGTVSNMSTGTCTWQTSGVCNWPKPVSNQPSTIDDLWHAAVNGFGTYFSATNPALLSTGISTALSGVSARTGASAAATTSNPNIATGDNFVFSSTFTSVKWDGEIIRQQINLTTGAISDTIDWSAQTLLDANTSRTIYTYDPAGTNRLKLFTHATLGSDQSFFSAAAIGTLSQFCSAGSNCLSPASKALAAGENLVEFLRGDRSNEGADTDITKFYRERSHVLGDIVNSEAVYVKAPRFNYTDAGYAAFKAAQTARKGMVYVGANDGMLHAFDATTGNEVWAYIPSLVLPNLYKLADKNYSALHQFLVDGTPVQGDVFIGGVWRTILVGGLGAGGRGYYALDVTDPNTPIALWEFTSDVSKGTGYTTDANLGQSFGKPEITKLKDGTWVVIVTSGYNNVSPGDGRGYLYVLNAQTGAKVKSPITTGVGSTGTPSGLAQIRTFVDAADENNNALRAYGGDLFGNLWRFDFDDNLAPAGNEALALATFLSPTLTPQPITAKPEVGDVNGSTVVYVGTGRFLGVTDLTDGSKQTIYAVKDNLGTTGLGNPRTQDTFVEQVLTIGACPPETSATICSTGQIARTSTDLEVDFATKNGWFIDLPDSGERANNDPQLALGTIIYSTNVPNPSACNLGGFSLLYFFDYKTGGPVITSTTKVVGKSLGNELATRPVFAKLPNNKVISITRLGSGKTSVDQPPTRPLTGTTRRVSWRELFTD